MTELRVEVPGWPIAWARPSVAGGRARGQRDSRGGWHPAAAERQLEILRGYLFEARCKLGSAWKRGEAVSLDTEFQFERAPSSRTPHGLGNTIIVVRTIEDAARYRVKTPDLDNLSKLVQETLGHSGVVDDDKQVVELTARKLQV